MIAILCVDNQNGLMFGKRRQSRDRLLLEDIRELCGEKALLMNEYSGRLFLQYGFEHPTIAEDFLSLAGPGEFCFVEADDLLPYQEKLEGLTLYRWNRIYPADLFFNPALIDSWTLRETKDFPGSSHQLITREVYER